MSDFKFQLFLDLLENHTYFKEKSITQRRFKHQQIIDLLDNYSDKYQIKEIGRSVQGRSIRLVSIGRGETKILLWSQMHGDEPTSTMALMDILSFWNDNNERFENIKRIIERELTICFVPVLNPDGMEAYTRRNAIGIDLNRDAKTLTSPESKAFKSVIDKIKPQFAFNLHDQNPRYTVGDTTEIAAISFLAPPFDFHRSQNQVRDNAMKVIATLNHLMQKILPGKVGRFSDEYEGRAFGDNIQKWGTSTILLESGGFLNDPEKQELRKLNFSLLLSAFHSIASQDYQKIGVKDYESIPMNTRNVYDLIIRNAAIEIAQKDFIVDIGINRYELPSQSGFYFKSKIEELGDLSLFRGLEELDASGMHVVKGKSFEQPVDFSKIDYQMAIDYLKQGFTYLMIDQSIKEEGSTVLPVNFTNKADNSSAISIESNADLIFISNGKVNNAVVNGFPINLSGAQTTFYNALLIP